MGRELAAGQLDGETYAEMMAPLETAPTALLEERALLRRTDSKFLLSGRQLAEVIAGLADHYQILRTGGAPWARYETLYFDTGELRCFHDHRRGRRPRHKVRVRHYPARALSFLEVKTKRSEYITHKYRRPIEYGHDRLDDEDRRFVEQHCDLPAGDLEPRVWTNFNRSTLLGIATAERITIDTRLELVHHDREIHLPEVVIMEVKQAPYDVRSPVMLALRRLNLRRVSASKYCTSNVLFHGGLRFNRLQPAIRRIRRVAGL